MIKCIFWHCFFPEPTQLVHEKTTTFKPTMEDIPAITKQPSINLPNKSLASNKLRNTTTKCGIVDIKKEQNEIPTCSGDAKSNSSEMLQFATCYQQQCTTETQQTLSIKNFKRDQFYNFYTSPNRLASKDSERDAFKEDPMHFQQQVIPWLILRTKQKLFRDDDWDFGNTFFSLILNLKKVNTNKEDKTSSNKVEERYKYYGGTLVVCPTNPMCRWNDKVVLGKFWQSSKSCGTVKRIG